MTSIIWSRLFLTRITLSTITPRTRVGFLKARRFASHYFHRPVHGLGCGKDVCMFTRTSPFHVRSLQKRWNHSDPNVVLFNLADIGEGIHEVSIKEWFVKVGDEVKEFDAICEVQSDKASVTITSRYSGVIKEIFYDIDATAKVGKPLVAIMREGQQFQSPPALDKLTKEVPFPPGTRPIVSDNLTNNPPKDGTKSHIVPTLPSVRRMAKEHGIDLDKVAATGRDGRVLKDDLIRYLEELKLVQPSCDRSRESLLTEKDSTQEISFNAITKAMFSKMTESLAIPHFALTDEIDMTNLLTMLTRMRQSDLLGKVSGQTNTKINSLSYMVKACSMALSDYPIINSSLGQDKQSLVQKNYHNIGIAMDTKNGLIVPNIKNVQRLSVLEIAEELERLKNLSANGKLSMSDLSDTTFSISNIGSIGGVSGIPRISPPELAIGAVGRIQKLPRYFSGDHIEARDIMKVVWSADHRVIDGATLTRFSNLWKYYLENPSMMTMKLS